MFTSIIIGNLSEFEKLWFEGRSLINECKKIYRLENIMSDILESATEIWFFNDICRLQKKCIIINLVSPDFSISSHLPIAFTRLNCSIYGQFSILLVVDLSCLLLSLSNILAYSKVCSVLMQ